AQPLDVVAGARPLTGCQAVGVADDVLLRQSQGVEVVGGAVCHSQLRYVAEQGIHVLRESLGYPRRRVAELDNTKVDSRVATVLVNDLLDCRGAVPWRI